MMFYLDISTQILEEQLPASDQVSKVLELPWLLEHTTLQRTNNKLRNLDFDKMKDQLLDENGVKEESIATDSSEVYLSTTYLYNIADENFQ